MNGVAKRALLLILTVSLIASMFAYTDASSTAQAGLPSGVNQVSHGPIHVDNDSELAELISANHWRGDGTLGNPYIIENLMINATGDGEAIYFGNTTKYVEVRNCTLWGDTTGQSYYSLDAGITLCNVTHARVANNQCNDTGGAGILLLDGCANNTVLNNVCFDNGGFGIYLRVRELGDYCERNTVANNTCYGQAMGAYLYSTVSGGIRNNTVANNTFLGNSMYGLVLVRAIYNTIDANACDDGGATSAYGIYMEASNYNRITNNTCCGDQYGMFFIFCDNNTIERNNCSDNRLSGLFLVGNHNTVEHNSCDGNGMGGSPSSGIYVVLGQYNRVENNSANGNSDFGIWLVGNSGVINNNICERNGLYGIYGTGSHHNVMRGNTCNWNGLSGIFLMGSSYNDVRFNTCNFNGYRRTTEGDVSGIALMSGSQWNNVTNNVCNGNFYYGPSSSYSGSGILLDNGALYDAVENNTCEGNSGYGMLLDTAVYSRVANNTCSGNEWGGIRMYNCHFDIVINNHCNDNQNSSVRDAYVSGISMESSTDNHILHNQCDGNTYVGTSHQHGVGIEVAHNCVNIFIENNTCGSNGDFGIFVNSSSIVRIANNTVNGSPAGIFVEDSIVFIDGNELSGGSILVFFNGDYSFASGLINALTIKVSNAVDGKPVYFVKNTDLDNESVGTGYGEVILLNVSNAVVNDLDLGAGSVIAGYCSNIVIESNTIHGTGIGISLYYVDDCIVDGNEITDAYWEGVYLYNAYCCNLTENLISGGKNGAVQIIYADHLLIANNTLGYGAIFGINAASMSLSSIESNHIEDCVSCGVSLDDSYDNILFNNSFMNNNGASSVYDVAHTQARDNGVNEWNADGHGNFWSDMAGPDSNYDGIVDGRYRVGFMFGVFSTVGRPIVADRYPLALAIEFIEPTSPAYTNVSSIDMVGNTSSYYTVVSGTWFNLFNGEHGTCTMVPGTNNWTATLLLTEGINRIMVNLTDEYGSTATRIYVAYYDTVDPSATIIRPAEGYQTAIDQLLVGWRASDALSGLCHFEVYLDGVYVGNTTDMRYLLSNLADGEHTVLVKVYDRAGNSNSSQVVSFLVDTTGPAVEITSPEDSSYSLNGNVTVQWSATDLVGVDRYVVRIDGLEWRVVHGTNYTFVGLADGTHTIVVGAYDVLGNYAETSVVVIVDTVEPTAVVTPDGEGVDIDAVVVVEFNKQMNTSSVSIVVLGFPRPHAGRLVDGGAVPGTISWSGNTAIFTPSSLTYNSVYLVTVSGIDQAGHWFSTSWNFSTVVKAGDVMGQIVDASGKPLANVTVTMSNGDATRTNAEGRFVFADVDQGSYTISFVKDGYVTGSANATVVADEVDDLGKIKLAMTPKAADNNGLIIVAIVAGAIGIIVVAALLMRRKP